MKIFKILGITVSSVLLVLYLSFLFLVPKLLDPDNYKSQLDKMFSEQANIQLEAKDIRLVTYWNLQIKLVLEDLTLRYPNGKKLVSSSRAEAGVKLLPLILKKAELAPIKMENPKLRIRIEKDGRYDIEKFISELIEKKADSEKKKENELPNQFIITGNLPQIIFSNYEITLKDLQSGDILSATGKELKLSEVNFKDKVKLSTVGKVRLNGKDCVNYDLNFDTVLASFAEDKTSQNQIKNFAYNPIPVLKKYNISMDLSSDLKFSEKEKLKGKLDIKNLSYTLDGKSVKNSFANLVFDGNNININSNLYISNADKFVISGIFKNGKKPYVDLKVVSNKIPLATLQRIICAMDDILNIKSEIVKLKMSGLLEADFNVKSDMKQLQSAGFLRVSNASIVHKELPLKISAINSALSFDNNKIAIKNASAVVNNAKFSATGNIDERANINVNFTSDELPLSLLYSAFAPTELKQEVKVQAGQVKINGELKGQLQKLNPKVHVLLSNLKLRLATVNADTKVKSAKIELNTDKNNQFAGIAHINTISGNLPELKIAYSLPSVEADFNEKNINIKPASLKIDNSSFTINGVINDYALKPFASFNMKGKYQAKGALKFVPADYRAYVALKGELPVETNLSADTKGFKLHSQIFADANNHISALNINNLVGQNTFVNAEIETDGASIKVNDLTLYKSNKNGVNSAKFNDNMANAVKIISANGKLVQKNNNEFSLSNMKIFVPNKLAASIPNMSGSSLELKADLTLNGNMNSPEIKGYIQVPQTVIPQYKMSAQNLQADFAKDITAKAKVLNLNGSQFAFDAVLDKNFSKNIIVKNVNINSTYTDIQKMLEAIALLPQSGVSPNGTAPLIVQKGHAVLNKVKLDKFYATNAVCEFDIKNNKLNVSGFKANLYNGVVIGSLNYNLAYAMLKTKLQGRNIGAKSVFDAILGVNDQLIGSLNFDADLSMIMGAEMQYKKTLKGMINFSIAEGQMGTLGRLEHFIHASNLISQRFMKSNLNSIVQSIAPQNTGSFKSMKGHIVLSNGWAKIEPIYSSGAQMSLYINGRYNLLNNYAQLEIMGRVANDIVRIMGPLGEISLKKIVESVTSLPSGGMDLVESYKALKDEALVAKVPQLITQTPNTRLFRTVIDGEITKPTSVRTFKWLASELEISEAKANIKNHATAVGKAITSQIKTVTPTNSTSSNAQVETKAPQQSVQQNTTETTPVQSAPVQPIQPVQPTVQAPSKSESMPGFWDKID